MQLTRVDVYNLALGKIKVGKRVHSLGDEIVRRYMLPQVYDLVIASLLERHPWSFATKEAVLAETADDIAYAAFPNSIRRHSWVYPHDCQKILAVGKYSEIVRPIEHALDGHALLPDPHLPRILAFDFSRAYQWEVTLGPARDRVIHTGHGHAAARYLTNAVPEALWPAGFVNAASWAIAAEITRAESASDADADYRLKQAAVAFEAARRADVMDNGTGHRIPGDFILARDCFRESAGYVGGESFLDEGQGGEDA